MSETTDSAIPVCAGMSKRRPSKEEFDRKCNELYFSLKRLVKKKKLAGQLLPSETSLAGEYGLSRTSVRRIIARLQDEKLVTRVNGRGIVCGEILPKIENEFACLVLASNIHGNMIDDQPASRANFFVGLIETELIRHGIQVELDTFDHLRGSDFKTYVNRLKSAHIRGVICIYGLQEMEELNRKLADSGFYVLDIRNEQSSNATINTIWYDNYLVGRIAAGFLVENSHRNICCIASDLGLEWEKERISAFEDMIRAADGEIRGSVLRLPSPSAEGKRECWEAIGRNAVDRLLQIGNISAAFCVNDGIAAGLCRELQRRKLNVPGDISVIGCDNDYTYWDLGLSTVSLECLRLGTVAADIMNKCLRGERDSVLTSAIKIPPLLIPRKTVRKLGS